MAAVVGVNARGVGAGRSAQAPEAARTSRFHAYAAADRAPVGQPRSQPALIGRLSRPPTVHRLRGTGVQGRGGQVVCMASERSAPGTYGPVFKGVGSATPSHLLTNEDLSELVDTNDEWISTRTGIKSRRIMSGDETLTGLAAEASQKALEMAGVEASDIDLIIMATSSPDDAFGNACLVQAAIGAKGAAAFDLTAACSGFVMALVTGSQYIRSGGYRNILVIGADALSRYLDWRDRSTCILFGDGAGAVVLQAEEGKDNLLGYDLRSDGKGNRHLTCSFNSMGLKATSETPGDAATYENIAMSGGDVFKFAVRAVPQVVKGAMKDADVEIGDIDWLVLHQANQRILDAAADRLGVPREQVVSNLAKYGNTSAASIPLALDEAVRENMIKPGDTIATAGFGAGLSWGAAVVKWGDSS